MRRIELLAPARDYVSAVAAVDAGADAIYMGSTRFGARHAATNSVNDIARVVTYAHRYGVRVHATLNTLLYDAELADAEQEARALIAVGVDALIVQDMAFRRMQLPIELHASTQTAIRTPSQAIFLSQVGFARLILERALSVEQIRAICQATTAEVECFVHGAICVGYSGQCYFSRALSARSGNRGECSQPCRQTYDLEQTDGHPILREKHLLSVRDLNLSNRLGELIDAGVTSFKIEGRLKDISYVRNVVAYYRQRLDAEIARRADCCRASVGRTVLDFCPDPSKSFTRGESEYFFSGRVAGVASFDTPKSVGEFIGRVVRCDGNTIMLDRDNDLHAGDGICCGAEGTHVNAVVERCVTTNRRLVGLHRGATLYRNLDSRFRLQVERSRVHRLIPVKAYISITSQQLCLRYVDCEGVSSEVTRQGDFPLATDALKSATSIQNQIRRSGDTPFEVIQVEYQGDEWFVPTSVVGAMRREALAQLLLKREQRTLTHRILPEQLDVRYPSVSISAEGNITNHIAETFYRDHGVQQIMRGVDCQPSTHGCRVMHTAYCIRREIGECLREGSSLRGPLYIRHGARRFRLDFDCVTCEMSLIDD